MERVSQPLEAVGLLPDERLHLRRASRIALREISVQSGTFQLANRVRLLPLAVALAVVAYLAVARAGTLGLVLVATSAAFAIGLALVVRDTDASARSALVSPAATGALLVTPALATLYLAFSSGGFYADGVALCTVVLLVLFAVRCALAEEPFGLGGAALAPAAALTLLAGWALASGTWSDSTGRALLEVDRILLYLLALLLLATLARSSSRLGFAVRALAAAFVLVALAGLVSRVAPDVLPTPESFAADRLSYPLTYWNALGVSARSGWCCACT